MPHLNEMPLGNLLYQNPQSAWDRGVLEYMEEMVENIRERGGEVSERNALNGASNWEEYSWGGSSLIYNSDICERLCNNTEKKRTKNGERRPNAREEWLDTQARALKQAWHKIETYYYQHQIS